MHVRSWMCSLKQFSHKHCFREDVEHWLQPLGASQSICSCFSPLRYWTQGYGVEITAEYCISSSSALVGKSKHKTQYLCTHLWFVLSATTLLSLHLPLTLSLLVSLSAVMLSLIHAPISLDTFYSLLCIQLLAATASWLLVFEKCTHALGKQNNMQMLRLYAHTTVSHMHTVLALKFNAGRNYELLPQVSAKQLFGILYWVVACTWSSGLVSCVVIYDWARNKL